MGLKEVLGKPEAADQMRKVENAIAATCHQFKDNTEAMIVVFALIRVATVLLNFYRPNTRKEIIEQVLVPKLHGEHRDEGMLFQ